MKTIYIAGPDVFFPGAKAHGDRLQALCQEYGFTGLFPLDNEIKTAERKLMAAAIKKANIDMIRRCDIVIANLQSFRGSEPDSGTVWEVGFAQGLGKAVYGYCSESGTLKQKVKRFCDLESEADVDKQGRYIEDFGLSHNLMYSHIIIAETFEEVLQKLARKENS